MDNIDDPETNAKVSDSAYSHSCSNSQSRRSHSSKSTHSGSNSSGSSGYGGKASTTGSSALCQPPKKDKDSKKKKQSPAEVKVVDAVPADESAKPAEPDATLAVLIEESQHVAEAAKDIKVPEMGAKCMETSTPEVRTANEALLDIPHPVSPGVRYATIRPNPDNTGGFSCVISMHDGIVMYTSNSIATSLGFSKDIWLGRSFIDFIHPRDHKTFASMITSGLGLPKLQNGRQGLGLASGSSMIGRIRRYRSLKFGFGVKENEVQYTPFLLKFFFKDYCGVDLKVICLVVQATPFHSVFKTPEEVVTKPFAFVIRHGPDGIIEYIDPESIPFLGYLPQDMLNQNAVNMYHPDELPVLLTVYENVVKEGSVPIMKPYRILTQNGDYIQVETEWSSVINPWSKKLEFVIAKHHVITGPTNPDVFSMPEPTKITEAEKTNIQCLRDRIIGVMTELRTKSAEALKQRMGKRCQDLAAFVESLMEKPKNQLRLELPQLSCHERDSEIELGGLSPHQDSVSKSSSDTPLSYNQLNFNENLQRYFDSQIPSNCYGNHSETGGPFDFEPKAPVHASGNCSSPMGQNSGDWMDLSSNSSAVAVWSDSPGQVLADNQTAKLTSHLIVKHNAEMEKEFVKKTYREMRASKEDTDKAETRKKKKEHLARCNASFHPTSAGDSITERVPLQATSRGQKRAINPKYIDRAAHKHHCPAQPERQLGTGPSPFFPSTSTVGATQWASPQNANRFNQFSMPQQGQIMTHRPVLSKMPGHSIPPAAAGVAYAPMSMPNTSSITMPGTSSMSMQSKSSMHMPVTPRMSMPNTSSMHMPVTPRMSMPNTSSMHMPVTPRMSMPSTSNMHMPVTPRMSMPNTSSMHMPVTPRMSMQSKSSMHMPVTPRMSMSNTSSMHMPVTPRMSMPNTSSMHMPVTPRMSMPNTSSMHMPGTSRKDPVSGRPVMPTIGYHRPYGMSGMPAACGIPAMPVMPGMSMPYMVQAPMSMMYGQPVLYSPLNSHMYTMQNVMPPETQQYSDALNLTTSNYDQTSPVAPDSQYGHPKTACSYEENAEKTDGESSYSSFYSSFFKTDSNSADDSGDQNNKTKDPYKCSQLFYLKYEKASCSDSSEATGTDRDDIMSEPYMTPDSTYTYQIATKPIAEVLRDDKQKMRNMEQPALVNEQLGQLYLDLQLQGVTQRLTLEEGITSSSSSGEESGNLAKLMRKRKFNKLAIIHEENAPLPDPRSGFLVPEDPAQTDDTSTDLSTGE